MAGRYLEIEPHTFGDSGDMMTAGTLAVDAGGTPFVAFMGRQWKSAYTNNWGRHGAPNLAAFCGGAWATIGDLPGASGVADAALLTLAVLPSGQPPYYVAFG